MSSAERSISGENLITGGENEAILIESNGNFEFKEMGDTLR
jgi:hypothetical protein